MAQYPEGFTPADSAGLQQQQTRVEAGTTGTPTTPAIAPAPPPAAAKAATPPRPAPFIPPSPSMGDPNQPVRERLQGWAGEAGLMLGMGMSAPAMAAATRAAPWLAKLPMGIVRVIFGALGDEAAQDLFGAPLGKGAVEGAVSATVGEGVVGGARLAGTLARKVPFVGPALAARGQARQAAAETARTQAARAAGVGQAGVSAAAGEAASQQTAQQLGSVLGTVAPPLPAATTAEALSNLGTMRGQAKQTLGAWTASEAQAAQQSLPNPAMKFRVPALGVPNEARLAAEAEMGFKSGATIPAAIETALAREYGPRQFEHFTLPELAERLKPLGASGWAGAKETRETRRLAGEAARVDYKKAMGQIEDAVSSVSQAAWEQFRDGRHAMSVGLPIVRALKNEGIFLRSPESVSLDLPKFQRVMRKYADQLHERMTPDEWRAFMRVFHGGELARESPSLRALTAAEGKALSQRIAAPPAPPKPPQWGQAQIPRIFFDAAVNRVFGD